MAEDNDKIFKIFEKKPDLNNPDDFLPKYYKNELFEILKINNEEDDLLISKRKRNESKADTEMIKRKINEKRQLLPENPAETLRGLKSTVSQIKEEIKRIMQSIGNLNKEKRIVEGKIKISTNGNITPNTQLKHAKIEQTERLTNDILILRAGLKAVRRLSTKSDIPFNYNGFILQVESEISEIKEPGRRLDDKNKELRGLDYIRKQYPDIKQFIGFEKLIKKLEEDISSKNGEIINLTNEINQLNDTNSSNTTVNENILLEERIREINGQIAQDTNIMRNLSDQIINLNAQISSIESTLIEINDLEERLKNLKNN